MSREVLVIGGGPAGLIAADRLSASGAAVTLVERMPSVGRKLLMAGRGGLNLTHGEPLPRLLARYGERPPEALIRAVQAFPPEALVAWCHGLGEATFTGSSGRIFPRSLKASPLLRALLQRLERQGVRLSRRTRWLGLDPAGRARLEGPDGVEVAQPADAVLLAMGGASWPRLGADGAWVPALAAMGLPVRPLLPANGGVDIAWSASFKARFAGEPLKRLCLRCRDREVAGEAMVTAYGLEGGAVYALAPRLRAILAAEGTARLEVDLRPDLDGAALAARIAGARPGQSTAETLRKRAGLSAAAANLLREPAGVTLPRDPAALAARIKAVPLAVTGLQGLDRAISTAGGLGFEALDPRFMIERHPGLFVAGEMLDWEAPTGGYLLQACLSTGMAAAEGMLGYLAERDGGAGTTTSRP